LNGLKHWQTLNSRRPIAQQHSQQPLRTNAMIFTETEIHGAFLIDLEPIHDARGYFARSWCHREFEQRGLVAEIVQTNVCLTRLRGTIRGLHYQAPPCSEAKIVRCTQGEIHDVIVDLRPGSPTHLKWTGVRLAAAEHRMLYVPEGVAHGYQTLCDNVEILYYVSQFHSAAHERGVRYNDPSFQIIWPLAVSVVSEKDTSWGDFQGVTCMSKQRAEARVSARIELSTRASDAAVR
jgi:dTDP-4-dehydrorhamnose 3,5-epimerase